MSRCQHCQLTIADDERTLTCPQCNRVFHLHCAFEERICHKCRAALEGEDVDFKPELDE